MAVPSLADKAALTLFHNPRFQTNLRNDIWEPYTAPVTTIQKMIRSYLSRANTWLGRLSADYTPRDRNVGSRFLSATNRAHWESLDNIRGGGIKFVRLNYRIAEIDKWINSNYHIR